MSRSFSLTIAFLAAVLYFTLFGVPRALGQPPTPIAVDETYFQNAPSAAQTQTPCDLSLGDHCRPDFWIVSTRHCQQRAGNRCGLNCPFNYIRYHPNGCLEQSDDMGFHNSLEPGVPVCIVIHGSFVQQRYLISESLATYQWIRAAAPHLPLHVVFFTWPSESICSFSDEIIVLPQIDVALLGRRAGLNGFYLAHLIGQVPSTHPICLFGHSHGARMASSALHLLGGGTVQGRSLQRPGDYQNRIRAVFAAAAIDHNWLNPTSKYGRALCRVEGVLSLRSQHDLPLFFYPLHAPFARRSLARAGFTQGDRQEMGWLSNRAVELDVTSLIETGHTMPHFYTRPEIASSIVTYLYYSDMYEYQTSTASTSQ